MNPRRGPYVPPNCAIFREPGSTRGLYPNEMGFSCTTLTGVPGAIPNEAIVFFSESYDTEAEVHRNVTQVGGATDEVDDKTYGSLQQIAGNETLTEELRQKLCDRVAQCRGNILAGEPTAAPQCWALGALGLQAAAAEVIADQNPQ